MFNSPSGPGMIQETGAMAFKGRRSDNSTPSLVPAETPTTDEGRRQAAIQLFDQYGISCPYGWLSEEDEGIFSGDRAKRSHMCHVCHICGDRMVPQIICPSCGHVLCSECTRLATTTTQDKKSSTTVEERFDSLDSVAVAPGHLEHAREVRETRTTRGAQPPPFDLQTPSPLKHPDTSHSKKTKSLKTNPFVVADQLAKTKGAEPRASRTSVHNAPRPKTPDFDMLPEGLDDAEDMQMDRQDEVGESSQTINLVDREQTDPMPQSPVINASQSMDDTAYLSSLDLSSNQRIDTRRHPQEQLKGDTDRKESQENFTAIVGKRSPRTSPVDNAMHASAPMSRRGAPRHMSSTGNLESVAEVDFNERSSKFPRVRQSGPTAGLKQATQTPAGVGDRIGQASSSVRTQEPHQAGTEESLGRRSRAFRPGAVAGSHMGEQVKKVRPRASWHFNEATAGHSSGTKDRQNTSTTARATHDSRRKIAGQHPKGLDHPASFTSGESRRHHAQHDHSLAEELSQADADVSSASQERKSKAQSEASGSQQDGFDDIGLEGITIVLHFRDRSDVVISTDLRRSA